MVGGCKSPEGEGLEKSLLGHHSRMQIVTKTEILPSAAPQTPSLLQFCSEKWVIQSQTQREVKHSQLLAELSMSHPCSSLARKPTSLCHSLGWHNACYKNLLFPVFQPWGAASLLPEGQGTKAGCGFWGWEQEHLLALRTYPLVLDKKTGELPGCFCGFCKQTLPCDTTVTQVTSLSLKCHPCSHTWQRLKAVPPQSGTWISTGVQEWGGSARHMDQYSDLPSCSPRSCREEQLMLPAESHPRAAQHCGVRWAGKTTWFPSCTLSWVPPMFQLWSSSAHVNYLPRNK